MSRFLQQTVREGRWVQPTSAAGVLGIGAAAFLLSYDALHQLALASGVRPGLARVWPGVLDGFIVVATLTVVAAKRAGQPTWYPWALVGLFSAASVAFNILHALGRFLAAARWVGPLVFAMPPVALVLATHLLLQQGAWQRRQTHGDPQLPPPAASATAAVAGRLPSAATAERVPQPVDSPAAGPDRRAASRLDGRQGHGGNRTDMEPAASGRVGAATEVAVREQARELYAQATAAGRKVSGAELGRAVGKSDRYGRLLLAEFRAADDPAGPNGDHDPEGGPPR
jgi:Protein of unknown function (DUF2637)